jgi:arsenate reductase (glutaredoxin)
MRQVKIFHNPRCTKSRQALQLLHDNGVEPEVVEYLKNPLSVKELSAVIGLLDIKPRELLRKNESAYTENHLSDLTLSDAQIIKIMHDNPSLIERPIVVVNNNKAVIGRPPENILSIL